MASNQDQMELLKLHQGNQDRYTYFLLATAAAGIAFAVQKTGGTALHLPHVLLGVAVTLWGASFWAGCRQIYWVQACITANYSQLQLSEGNHSQQPQTPQELEAAKSGVGKAFEHNLQKATSYAAWQFRLLVAGAVVFVGWHIIEMYLLRSGT